MLANLKKKKFELENEELKSSSKMDNFFLNEEDDGKVNKDLKK